MTGMPIIALTDAELEGIMAPPGESDWLRNSVIAWTADPRDRSEREGAAFASDGVGGLIPPGPMLARLASDVWDAGLGDLNDDELIGVLRAARRLTSWAAALELSAAGELMRRRLAAEAAGQAGVAEHADDEVAAALTLTGRAAGLLTDQAMAMSRLPATMRALAAGEIDVPRAYVIASEVTGLSDLHAAIVEQVVIRDAPGQTTSQLRAAVRRSRSQRGAQAQGAGAEGSAGGTMG